MNPSAAPSRPMAPRRGFTLTEIMFAVVILGIGFILVAGVFPVAILQTRTTVEETGAQAYAVGVADQLRAIAAGERGVPAGSSLFLPTGTDTNPSRPRVFSILDPQSNIDAESIADFQTAPWAWIKARGVLRSGTDPRNAAVVLYRRAGRSDGGLAGSYADAADVAQVYVIAVAPRNTPEFTADDTGVQHAPGNLVNLQARPVEFSLTSDGWGPLIDSDVTITAGNAVVAEGAFLVIADDNLAASPLDPANAGRLNGRVYRIGRNLGGNRWSLAPGYEFSADPDPDGGGNEDAIPGLTNARGFVVGRSFAEPSNGGSDTVSGPAMDVALYSVFLPVPN